MMNLKEFIGKHLFERSPYYDRANHKILIDNKSKKEIIKELDKCFSLNTLQTVFPSKIICTCSCNDVDREMPLKSAFTGYFLWFLLTNTAVLNCFKGTFKKCLTP